MIRAALLSLVGLVLVACGPARVDGSTAPGGAGGAATRAETVSPGVAEDGAPGSAPGEVAARARRVEAEPLLDKAAVSAFLYAHHAEYRQIYTLSCEVALMRMALAYMGVRRLSEDDILAVLPRDGEDPEKYFVCDDLMGGRRGPDGSIHWNNYGTHPPVVIAGMGAFLAESGIGDLYVLREEKLTDAQLKGRARDDPKFLGAIVWLVGHPERWGFRPLVNERGMVLGEHVRFVGPALDAAGKLVVWDPEPVPGQPALLDEIPTRDNFQNRVVAIYAR